MEENQIIPASNLPVKRNFGLTKEQINLLKRTIAKGVSDDELKLFMHIANRTKLDPFARQIYAVKRWNSDVGGYVMVPQTGIDGYRLIAERTGNYAPGKDTSYEYGPDGKIISATAYIQKKVGDQWFEVAGTARLEEYQVKKKDGTPTAMWLDKPHVMLGKCAEALALRRAFPAELSGVYVEEEIGGGDEFNNKPAGSTDVLTPKELTYFHTQITKTGLNRDIVKARIKEVYGKDSSKNLTHEEAQLIISWAEAQGVGQ